VNLGKIRVPLVVYRPPSSSPDPTMRSIDRKPSSMGIAELEPRQLAPTVGTTGSRSTGSPAPSSSSRTPPLRLHLASSSTSSSHLRSSPSSMAESHLVGQSKSAKFLINHQRKYCRRLYRIYRSRCCFTKSIWKELCAKSVYTSSKPQARAGINYDQIMLPPEATR
jgi:hypothetical protein